MLRFILHWTRLPVKFFKNNINADFKSIKIKKKILNFLLIYTVNSHINKDLKNCTGSGILHTTEVDRESIQKKEKYRGGFENFIRESTSIFQLGGLLSKKTLLSQGTPFRNLLIMS